MTELLIIVLLTVVNGVFSMSEAAVIAARKIRLQQQAERGNPGAKTAIELAEEPNRFLSTVQIGITLIGILSGAFGGATVAESIAEPLRDTALAPYANAIGFGAIVLITAYLSLVIGELVPKRLALRSPEGIAAAVSRPMRLLSVITAPIVRLLSLSTDAVLFLLGAKNTPDAPVTEEEITAMIQQGIEAGVFEEAEHEMVQGVFRLGEQRVSTVMTPRTEIVWLNIEDSFEVHQQKIVNSEFSRFPVCEGDLDHVLGFVHTKTLLSRQLAGQPFDLRAAMQAPNFVPESMTASKLLDMFRETSIHIALVIGEYGGVQGLITIQNILEEIVGDIEEEDNAVQREDGSWLLDGMTPIEDFKDLLELDEVPGEHDSFETLGGFVMMQQGAIPRAGDHFTWRSLRFEVMDMDGNRVDKVLVSPIEPPTETEADAPPEA